MLQRPGKPGARREDKKLTAPAFTTASNRNSEPDTAESFYWKSEVQDYIRKLGGLLDNLQVGAFVEEFSDDGHYQLIPRENLEGGYPVCLIDDSKPRLRYRQRMIEKHWHHEKFRELRMLSPVSVEVTDGGRAATAVTNFVIFRTDDDGASKLHVCGTFHDEFVKLDRWRIRNRKAILDTYLPTQAIVLPP